MRRHFSLLWNALVPALLIGGAISSAPRFSRGELRFLELSFQLVAAVIAVRLVFLRTQESNDSPEDRFSDIVKSCGPMMIVIGLDGAVTEINPAAELLLGYHAEELVGSLRTADILAPNEGPRIIAELQRMAGTEPDTDLKPHERLNTLMQTMRDMQPSQVPSFDAHFRRKEGSLFQVTAHVSALRNRDGIMQGLVVVAIDVSSKMRQALALRESQERYRDLFENSAEMIATLSTTGKFLYANPAWKRCFGLSKASLLALDSFEDIFGTACRPEVSAIFRRAIGGESIERAALRNYTADGRMLDFELSLSQRQRAGSPLAVRCLLRDVTQQKQREHRLALQLVVSQIVGENNSPVTAMTRILEAICTSQDWDMALHWEVNADESGLEFCTAWWGCDRRKEDMLQEDVGRLVSSGVGIAGRSWQQGRPVWIGDLLSENGDPRIDLAVHHQMLSGWAVPVRVGNRILAVLEFYSQRYLREDSEALASLEMVASSIGQMLARNRECGRAEELAQQQQILLDSVADGICGIDRHGLVSFANPAAARMLGYPADLMTGIQVHDLLHGSASAENKCEEDCQLRRAFEHEIATTGESSLYRSDGTSFAGEYFFAPILDHGHFSGSVISFRDISQRHLLDSMKDEFISTVSHELRTPLTSIRGALGLLSSGILGDINEKAANLLRIAATNSDRLVRLINDILDLERIQSGREPITFRPVILSELVRQAIDGMQPVADAACIQLIHEGTSAEISGDPDRLLQVLTNLLSNAIKFSSPNSAVSVMIRPGTSGVMLSVIDEGRGIPADKLEAIFGRFQQVDASDARQKGGSGLGLAICRTIVQQHSGRVWAERNPILGSTFRVFLPYTQTSFDGLTASDAPEASTILLADSNRVTNPVLLEKHRNSALDVAS